MLRCALGPTTSMGLWAIIERLVLKRVSKPSVRDEGLKFDAAVEETKAALELPTERPWLSYAACVQLVAGTRNHRYRHSLMVTI